MTGRSRRTRRGSALMMVITAMATGLVLSTAYVAARTNGTVIGANLAASSEARVEAESSLALTVAALTSSHDWRTLHQNGLLFEHAEEGREIRVDLIDMATGAAPNESTVDVKASISSRVDGIERTAEAEFFIALPEQARSIDVDLGEFAMFAGDSITVRSEAVVESWSASPAHNRGDPIRVATSLGASSGVRVEGSGTIVRGVEYAAGNRSIDSGPLPLSRIPDGVSIPMPSPPHALDHADYIENPTGRLDVDTRVGALTLDSGQTIELAGGADLLVEGDLNLSGGATLRVSGDSHLVVKGDAKLTDAIIEVDESASFVMHVGGDLDFRHTTVTEPNGDVDDWVPEIDRVRFVALLERETIPSWRVRGRSLIKGEFYAPNVNFKLQGRAVLVGRVAAQTVLAEGRSCLLYDPALDDRNGYTAIDQRAYDSTGDLLPALAELTDLSSESLAAAAEDLGIPIVAGEEVSDPETPEERSACNGNRRHQRSSRSSGLRWHEPQLWTGGHHANQRHANWSVNVLRIGAPVGVR